MRRPVFRTNDPPRKVQSPAGSPIGFLQPISDRITQLSKDIQGVELRLGRSMTAGEPGAAVGEYIFTPDLNSSFLFDYLQDGVAGTRVDSQYVVRDAVTYDIPIIMPPPGVLLVRSMSVRLYQRLYVPGSGPWQVPMLTGDFNLRAQEVFQTKKFSFPDNGLTAAADIQSDVRRLSRRCAFFWNITDTKSGFQYADDLLPDNVLLPHGVATEVTGRYLEFRSPWLFERDGQLSFQFRPIMPVIQPAASSSYAPYPFEDREQSNTKRDSSVTVRIDLHGERYHSARDAMNEGARSR